jgi:hypothetical protein
MAFGQWKPPVLSELEEVAEERCGSMNQVIAKGVWLRG